MCMSISMFQLKHYPISMENRDMFVGVLQTMVCLVWRQRNALTVFLMFCIYSFYLNVHSISSNRNREKTTGAQSERKKCLHFSFGVELSIENVIWILVFTSEWELFDRKSIDFKLHFITSQIEIALRFCYAMTMLEHWTTKPTPPAPIISGNFIQIRFNRSYK